MEKIRILIVEDENIVAKDIENIVKNLGYIPVDITHTGKKAIEIVEEKKPDIVLMDIKLKGSMSGIEAADVIREKYLIPVIYLTAYADDATLKKAKITQPYGYIIKPFKEKDIQTAIEMAIYKHEKDIQVKKERDFFYSIVSDKQNDDGIFVRADYRLNNIKFADIFFVEALKDYVVIHTKKHTYTTHSTMKDMEKILPKKDFVRVHRSYIVRLDKILSIKYPDLVIEGKLKVIQIGGLYRKELYNRLNIV